MSSGTNRTCLDVPCAWKSVRIGKGLPGDATSEETFINVMSWIKDCTEKHHACGPGEASKLPRRVLDLEAKDEDVVLYESHSEAAQYICLSHCWGNTRALTTSSSNLEEHKIGIPFGSLPRTFQDAVEFCRKMKVRYLWIDSLCIIQNDESDWQRESALMAQIYQNSYLTLAATGSYSDDEGLFYKLPQASVSGVLLDGSPYKVHARPAIRHFDDAEFPLFSRAWVFQERMLAPRVLHFGKQELWWECMESNHCECGGFNSGERFGPGQEKYESKITHQEIVSTSSLAALSPRWHNIIEEYSELNLTHSRDKLPALSGIADQMCSIRESRHIRNPRVHRESGRNYLAGLWSDTIISDLLWYRRDYSSSSLAEKWRAPTWSWAALDGPVKYIDTIGRVPRAEKINTLEARTSGATINDIHVQVLQSFAQPAGENQFGEIVKAHLRLRGCLLLVKLTRGASKGHGNRFEFRYFDWTWNAVPFYADYELELAEESGTKDNEKTSGYLLRLVTDGDNHEYGLVLRKVLEDEETYERIGMFRTNNLYAGSVMEYREHFKNATSKEFTIR